MYIYIYDMILIRNNDGNNQSGATGSPHALTMPAHLIRLSHYGAPRSLPRSKEESVNG